jgi:hypothetical protein
MRCSVLSPFQNNYELTDYNYLETEGVDVVIARRVGRM